MESWLWDAIEQYFLDLRKKISEHQTKNIFVLLSSLLLISVMGYSIFLYFGFFSTLSYVFVCVYGVSMIIDYPYKLAEWSSVFVIFTVMTDVVSRLFYPNIITQSLATISSVFIIYVVLMFSLKGRSYRKSRPVSRQ